MASGRWATRTVAKCGCGSKTRGISPLSRRLRWLLRVCSGLVFWLTPLQADDPAAGVVLLANADDPDSLRVAEHYASARGVPRANMVALPMPRSETISWAEFTQTIWEPLQRELTRAQWIDAVPMRLTDAVGRTKRAVAGHRISYLVVCRGVPLRIAHEPTLYEPVPAFTGNTIFRTNASSVDSELNLLANPNYAINAFVPNPLHRNDRPSRFERAAVVKVSRLDGPTAAEAMALVDRAIAAERVGLQGRAYVDLGGVHPDGDRWLEAVVRQLREQHFDTEVDREPGTFAATARFDAPVLYFGWHTSAINGPFTLPGFHFPPGAIALHIHSFSAQTLRSEQANWCGPLVARGVTATVGNVFEPYLQLTHRPDLLLRVLLAGGTFGDAVCYAQPALSWQTVAVGDPLYRPFGAPAEAASAREAAPLRLAGYAVVRAVLAQEASRRPAEALILARNAQREQPTLAVGLALAQRLRTAGDREGAAAALEFLRASGDFATDEWAAVREAASILAENGRPDVAVTVYRKLAQQPQLPRELKLAWLPEAIAVAMRIGDAKTAQEWRTQLRDLQPAPAEPATGNGK